MADEGFKRKLAAILSADVEGYSRLMGDDEEATVRTLTSYREVLSTLIQQHNGKVLDSPGDNLLAEFASVVDAVQCAVAVQKEIKSRNDELPENRRMQFRIGINLGDVIQEEDRIYGDGVNIAARLESLAEPGGICISRTAFDHIESKLPYGYEFLGDQTVKNIAKPIGAYRVLMEPRVTVAGEPEDGKPTPVRRRGIIVGVVAVFVLAVVIGTWQYYMRRPSVEPASVEKMAYSLPDKPSIAVLPFDNLSGDPDQNYISDGISENIISALSKIEELFVISRNSTFVFKGKAVKVPQVAEDLGVRYVMEGSVQKSDDKIRVTAQLIDAISGYHLWSEKYDREIKDFFQLSDEITHKIVIALQVKLTHGEQVRRLLGTTNFEAWGYTVGGISLFEHGVKQDNERARERFKQALKIDPNYAFAWLLLAWTHYFDSRLGWTKTPSDSMKLAIQLVEKAQAIDDTLPEYHCFWGTIYILQKQYEKAIAEGRKSIERDPNSAWNHVHFAQILFYAGNFHDAAASAEQATRLSPYSPAWYWSWLGLSYRHAGRYQDALETFKKLLDRAQKGGFSLSSAHSSMAITYAMMGQYEKARLHWEKTLKHTPNPSAWKPFIRKFFYPSKDPEQVERVLDALQKAGCE
jgi:adenylate cyclase